MVRLLSLSSIVLASLILNASRAEAQTIYWKKDYIRDASGAAIAVATPAPSDTTVPTTPGQPSTSGKTDKAISLSWSGSTDAIGIAGYVIYRGAVPVGAVTGTTFSDLGLIPNTSYQYRIVAFDPSYNYSEYSLSHTDSTDAASGSPLNLVAAATSTTQVYLQWTQAASGAPDHYGIWRRNGSGSYTKIDTTSSTSYSNSSLTANTAYLYKVSAENSSNVVTGWSNVDLATTILFTDDTITTGVTEMKAAHVTELRTAVNAVRALAGLSAASWTNSSLTNATIYAVDVSELRTKLGEALPILALTTPSYTDTSLVTGTTIKKAHIEELRNRVK
jgi:chitodextrinase